MRVRSVCLVIVLGLAVPAFAAEKTVAQQVNDVNMLNQVTDYFATAGRSDVQKAAILKERKEQRRLARLRKLQKQKQENVVKRQKAVEDQKQGIKSWP